jgi:hypothetical protein
MVSILTSFMQCARHGWTDRQKTFARRTAVSFQALVSLECNSRPSGHAIAQALESSASPYRPSTRNEVAILFTTDPEVLNSINMLFLSAFLSSLAFASAGHKLSHPTIHARQAFVASMCRLNYTTDVWTGCDDVLAQFGIPLDGFIEANPGLGPACTNFVPGNTYCVSWRK